MWLITEHGFFSVVCTKKETPNMVLPNKAEVQIRARDGNHLANLKKHFPHLFDGYNIITTPNADYSFRLIVNKDVFISLLQELGNNIDYTNFKNHVHDKVPCDNLYEKFLNYVWNAGKILLENRKG